MKPVTKLLLKCQKVADSCTNADQAQSAYKYIDLAVRSAGLELEDDEYWELFSIQQAVVARCY